MNLPLHRRAEWGRAGYFRSVRALFVLGLAVLMAAAPARAEPRINSLAGDIECRHCDDEKPPSVKRRAAAMALAVVPGVVVHGIGSWTVGEKRAAKRLFYGELIGLGLAGSAGLLVGASGGNPYTMPAVPIIIGGAGLLFQSWFSDIWVAAGGDAIVERPRALPPWSVELGTSWLHDAYRDRALLRAGGGVWLGRLGLAAAALVDAGGDTKVGEADVYLRILGERASGELIDDGSHLTVRAGTSWHDDEPDRVTQWTQEIEVRGRLDLERVDPVFRSSFVELGTGIGAVHVDYDDLASEWESELLGHFAWGAYLGSRGEAKVFYEHTRDGLVGGLPAGRAAGFLGSIGGALDLRVFGPWAVRAELAIGNAWLSTLAMSYRGGPR